MRERLQPCIEGVGTVRDGFHHEMIVAAPSDTRTRWIPVMRLGDPDLMLVSESRLEAWTTQALEPFGGDTGRAANFALRVALARTGLRPDEPCL